MSENMDPTPNTPETSEAPDAQEAQETPEREAPAKRTFRERLAGTGDRLYGTCGRPRRLLQGSTTRVPRSAPADHDALADPRRVLGLVAQS